MDHSRTPDSSSPPQLLWPERLIALARELPSSETARGQFWLLLNLALQQRLRIERARTGPITDDDLLDLAADKSLELMTRLDSHKWNLRTASADRVTAFVSTVARNGLIDHLRKIDRRATDTEEDMDSTKLSANPPTQEIPDPAIEAEREGLVSAIVNCASKLKPVHRNIWLFRVFLDMPSKRIANHPEVGLTLGNVDVTLQRCRDSVRECVKKSGHDVTEIPPGTFTALWRLFRLDELTPSPTNQSRT
jgi:RNA polymerase sigma factor (sigma-70 family)